jgi:hypothetical protein
LFIAAALAIAAGRIAVVKSHEGDTAFLSANDRSRWSTVACLVERGSYVIDQQIEIRDPVKTNRRPWNTIDKVRHLGPDGVQHYYSSKPPLLATLVAGVYKLVQLVSGMTLTAQPVYVGRIVLALFNLPLLALFLFATMDSIDRVCASDWARRLAAMACGFGTMVLPFSITLNNHLPAAAATAVVMWIYLAAAQRLDPAGAGPSRTVPPGWWLIAGLSAAFAVANELPALSMTVFWFLLLAVLDRKSILPFTAGLVVVAIGFFGTNWLAHHSWRPPYAHRGNGELIAGLDVSAEDPAATIPAMTQVLRSQGLLPPQSELQLEPSGEAGRWVVLAGQQQFALVRDASRWQLHHWDDWYDYPGTYWRDGVRRGVDRGEPSPWNYLFHVTLGHHGIFSLTPIWLLLPIGLITGLGFGPAGFRRLAVAVLIATVVCLVFYVSRPLIDRNYGGVSVCFRWLLWLTPLWLLMIAPVMERLSGTRLGRAGLATMLAGSIFSVSTALATPWQSPWLYQFWQFLGWIEP